MNRPFINTREFLKLSLAIPLGVAACRLLGETETPAIATRTATTTDKPPNPPTDMPKKEEASQEPPTAEPTKDKVELELAVAVADLTADPYYYDQDYVDSFSKVEVAEVEVGGKSHHAIVGEKADGSRVTLVLETMTVNGELKLVRVSETVDPITGMTYRVFINPSYDVGDDNNPARIRITDKAAELILMEPKMGLLANLTKLHGQYFEYHDDGDTTRFRKMIAEQAAQGAGLPIQVMTQTEEPLANPYGMQWVDSPVDVRFDLPVELVMMGTDEEFQGMPKEIIDNFMIPRIASLAKEGFKVGDLVWVAGDGHLQILSLYNKFIELVFDDPDFPEELRYGSLHDMYGASVFGLLDMFGRRLDYIKDPTNAYSEATMDFSGYEPLADEAFDYIP